MSLALEAALRLVDDRLVAAAPHMVESKPMVALVLLGRFDEAIPLGERAREMWENAGRPAARWLAPPMYSLVLPHPLPPHRSRCRTRRPRRPMLV